MSESIELKWTETTSQDGITRIARDNQGIKRREELLGADGSNRVWVFSETGKLSSYQDRSSKNLLRAESFYYEDGVERISIGYFDNSAKNYENEYDQRGSLAKQTKWFASGRLASIVHYLDSYRHGRVIHFSEATGATISNEEYRNDLRDGLCEQYYATPGAETIKSRGQYAAGQIEGPYQEFYTSGVLRESGLIENRKHEGERKRYFETGVVSQIARYSAGELHGDLEDFFPTGRIRRRVLMVKGQMHGPETHFNEYGQMTSQSMHVAKGSTNETIDALTAASLSSNEPLELYHANGKLLSRHHRKNGVRHGPFQIFRSSGTIREAGNFENDAYSGPLNFYDTDELLIETICYRAGRMDGPRTTYRKVKDVKAERGVYRETEISRIQNYSAGLFQSERIYGRNGYVTESVEIESYGTGIARVYTEDGMLQRETEVRSNYSRTKHFRHGWDRVYSPHGLLVEAFYVADQPFGLHKFYTSAGVLKETQTYVAGRLETKSFCDSNGIVDRILTYFADGTIASDTVIGNNVTPSTNDSSVINPLQRGSMIGPYEVIRSIGHGGMGDVVLAIEKSLDRRVALKLIRGEADAESRARFEAEGRALARIRHPNVVTVFNVGDHNGLPFMAMEYIEGWPLNTLLGQGLLGFNEQISLFRQMVDGMIAAHDVTVLHRDLKPANLIVSKALEIKIIDFGISKILADDAGLTAPNMAMGTIRYMSPEVAQGRPASVPTDIYSMGVILFEMLAGETPFNGSNQLETLELIKNAPVIFPAGIDEILPESLKQLVFKMTAKKIEDRHSTLHEVLRDLSAISFEHLPEEFKIPMRPELEIANLEEAREILKKKGHNTSEFSLILNLASRIQQKIFGESDETRPLGAVSDFVISREALDQATKRYGEAKLDLARSKGQISNQRKN